MTDTADSNTAAVSSFFGFLFLILVCVCVYYGARDYGAARQAAIDSRRESRMAGACKQVETTDDDGGGIA